MQFKEMVDAGMHYLNDPKQLVFTSDQGLVVQGLLEGEFDVGFVRTDQLERSIDARDGLPVNVTRFKILDPKPGLEIDGVPFPFQSSTDLYAEWNVAGLTHVNPQVSNEVQRAMLSVADFAKVGQALEECIAVNGTEVCNEMDLSTLYYDGPIKCSATHAVVAAAYRATTDGKYAGWTTSLSYMQLRSMQEATGFISMEPDTKTWRCIRSTELYDAISCPAGYNRKTKEQVDVGCEDVGLECKEGYQCVCRPCEAPYELVCVDSVQVMGDRCVSLAIFLPSIILPVLLVVGVLVHFYIEHKRRQSDSLWIVKPSELEFENPPRVIGRGTFGLVLLAEYRGTSVAVKRVIPSSSSSSDKPVADTRNTLFDISKTTSTYDDGAGGEQQLLTNEDMEAGMRSFHPGMKSLAPAKLQQHLSEQARKLAEEQALKSQNGLQRFVHSWICCQQSENDVQARLKAEFVNEIRQLARLRHPCITTVMGAVMPTRRDEPMLVMEYMTHGSLYDVLQDDSIVLKPEQILAILQDVAQGLRFLHSATPQVIHGDLKAQNVLIDTNFCAKVTDFGLSGKKQIGAVGTPYWMSPELLLGESVNSAASDIYAYGMVMYEIYSGRPPYAGEAYEEVVRQICDPHIRKRPLIPLHCPARVAKLMDDCFQHDPKERPTAEQLDVALKVELKVKERTSRLEALNKDLAQANHKIASASAMQLQHFACMSHEIRTPLNCIIGLSSLLEETELNAMQQESMEMIVSSGKLLRQIVDDVLDCKYFSSIDRVVRRRCQTLDRSSQTSLDLLYLLRVQDNHHLTLMHHSLPIFLFLFYTVDSKLESGNAQVLIQKINLQETLNAVIHLIQTSAVTVDKKLNVITNYDPLLPEVIHSDSRRIQQILYNLLGNAIKFSSEEGKVEFGVSIVEDARIIRFSVKDFGKGIEEADFGKIFEPFRQTETGLSNATGGTGLGLAITKKLVDAMGGQIAVASEVGSWTEFTVDFPFKKTDRPVDAQHLSSKLDRSIILFIADANDPKTERVQAIFNHFNVQYAHFNTMRDLNLAMNLSSPPFSPTSQAGAYVCLAHEDLCEIETYELLAARFPACLATFGPQFSVERMTKKHWRSLVETFPSVLVNKLGQLAHALLHEGGRRRYKAAVVPIKAGWEDLRILIAEDNLVNQKVLTRILNRLGIHSIQIASNGVQAVERESKEAFDLVLMDMQMPKMDGIEACQEINKRVPKDGEHALAKIIFVTAHVSDTFRQTCLETGAIGYLPKPCTVEGVKEVLRYAFSSGRLFSPAYQERWKGNPSSPSAPSSIDGSDRSLCSSARSSNRGLDFSVRSNLSNPLHWFDRSKRSQG